MMLTGKQPASHQGGETRRAVPAGDVDALSDSVRFVPFHRHPVGGVLGRQPQHPRKAGWAELPKPDQADSGDPDTADQLRSKRRRDDSGEDVGIYPVVEQQTSFDGADHGGETHYFDSFLVRGDERRRRRTICSGHTAERNLPTETARRSSTNP
jgi:hypothetical protein